MGRSLGFASTTTNLFALFRLAFASDPPLNGLTMLATVTRRLIMQKARRHQTSLAPTACKRMVSGSISLPYSGFFSPFPHGTRSLSVSQEYLALPDGSGRFRQDFTCPALLRILMLIVYISCTGLSPSSVKISKLFHYTTTYVFSPTTPVLPKQNRFGLFPFRSPLLRKSLLFSLPTPT